MPLVLWFSIAPIHLECSRGRVLGCLRAGLSEQPLGVPAVAALSLQSRQSPGVVPPAQKSLLRSAPGGSEEEHLDMHQDIKRSGGSAPETAFYPAHILFFQCLQSQSRKAPYLGQPRPPLASEDNKASGAQWLA